MVAIGVDANDDETPAADTAPTTGEADSAAEAPAPASQANGAKKRAKAGPGQGQEGQDDCSGHRRAGGGQ